MIPQCDFLQGKNEAPITGCRSLIGQKPHTHLPQIRSHKNPYSLKLIKPDLLKKLSIDLSQVLYYNSFVTDLELNLKRGEVFLAQADALSMTNINHIDEAPEESDAILLEAFKGGDEGAFEKIVLRYRNRVYNIIFNVLHDRDLAWDGSQEVFLKIYNKIDTYQAKCPFGAWVYRIAVNHSLNILRKRKYIQKEVPINEQKMTADETNGPANSMMKNEFENQELFLAIEDLPRVQKSVIVLRHFNELSFKEIGVILKKSEDSVKSSHYYAIMKLRNVLGVGAKL